MTHKLADAQEVSTRILEVFGALEECPLPPEQLMAILDRFRSGNPESSMEITQVLTDVIARQTAALSSVQQVHEQMRDLIQRLTAGPYFPAVFLDLLHTPNLQGALVQTDSDRRVVSLGDGVQISQLSAGDEVYLSQDRNCLVAKADLPSSLAGEVATFSRKIGGGRMVLRARDEEVVVLAAGAIRTAELKAGEGVRFDRARGVAFEKIEASKGHEYFLEGMPRDSFDEIGGLDREIETLKQALSLHMFHAGTTHKYKLRRKLAVLMEGPPGNGKTKVARATCAWLGSLSPRGRSQFINVKPGGLNSMWFGATEQRYREVFRVAREAAAASPDPVVMFWDEIDAVGGQRGESVQRIDDRMLNAFMAELDGLEERGNIVILTATNRRDALDPALVRPGRLGDLVIYFPQPNRQAARAILARHLPTDIPYAANGEGPAASREALLDLAIGQLFAHNSTTELAVLTLRDGKQRTVHAADLVSGAQLEAIAQNAMERACVRDAEGGPEGVTAADIDAALANFFAASPRALTPRSARNYLRDLPSDVDVVRVDMVNRRGSHPHSYPAEVN